MGKQHAESGSEVTLALTVRQPWAALIAAGFKTIENRTWDRPAVVGQRIAIHASMGAPQDTEWMKEYRSLAAARALAKEVSHPRGAIVCTVVVAGFITSSSSPWFGGPIGWVLEDVEPCKPISCKGSLLLWRLPPAIVARLS